MVLLPHKAAPLHIFEERYKEMVQTCMDGESEFAIVSGRDHEFNSVGCAAIVTDLLAKFPDGRMNVLIRGTRRIRVLDRLDNHAYISGIVEVVEDDPGETDEELVRSLQDLYQEAMKLALGWLRAKNEPEVDASQLSYIVAGSLNLPMEEQQTILELRSVNERLRTVASTLQNALQGIREVKRRTRSNGHFA